MQRHAGMIRRARALNSLLIANQQKFEPVVAATCKRRTLDHYAHAFITAHRINGDTRQTHQTFSGSTGS